MSLLERFLKATYDSPLFLPFSFLFIDFMFVSIGGPGFSLLIRNKVCRLDISEFDTDGKFNACVEAEIQRRKKAGTI